MEKVSRIHGAMLPLTGNVAKHFLRIPIAGNLPDNADMNTNDYRRNNLAAVLLAKKMTKADLARLASMPPPNITQMLNGKRPFGAEVARRMEELLNLRYGYLDEEIPLTDQAIKHARIFQSLDSRHRSEVEAVALTLKSVEEHLEEAKVIRQSDTLAG